MTELYFNYIVDLSNYVFICTWESLYNQHYGGKDA
jgi:hypothetical protein